MPTVPVNSNLVAQSEAAAQAPRQRPSRDPGRRQLPVLLFFCAGMVDTLV